MLKQFTKSKRVERETEPAVEAVTDSTVSEEAECCLSAIDEALAEVTELTDEQILALGHPAPPNEQDYWTYEMGDDEYEAGVLAYQEAYKAYSEGEHARYSKAYERVHGVEHTDKMCCGRICCG